MRVEEILSAARRIGLDTAPIIYFVEGNAEFHSRCAPFFAAIDAETIQAVTSTITLPETLMHPLRTGDAARAAAFRSLLLVTYGLTTISLTVAVAERAARLRADYNLRTPDAVQIATALLAGWRLSHQ